MLVSMHRTFAYKCPSCGAFEFSNISIFDLNGSGEHETICSCGNKTGIVGFGKKTRGVIRMACIGCGRWHNYKFDISSLIGNRIIECKCPQTGIYLGFLGEDREVRERIDQLEEELDRLISMFGYENYFKNTQVMLQTLNKIHDIAEKGNLFCECGSSDVELVLFSDMIKLKCKKCPGIRIICAGNNMDLKSTLKAQNIFLSSEI